MIIIMKRLITSVCLTISLALGIFDLGWSGDFQKGQDAYDKSDYATALKEWTPLAEQGNAVAQSKLGFMYSNGLGVPLDYKIALKWSRLSAEQGNATGQFNLAYIYRNGLGLPQDYKTAVKWYTLSAKQGDSDARGALGYMYYKGLGVPQDYKTAINGLNFQLNKEMQEHSLTQLYVMMKDMA